MTSLLEQRDAVLAQLRTGARLHRGQSGQWTIGLAKVRSTVVEMLADAGLVEWDGVDTYWLAGTNETERGSE